MEVKVVTGIDDNSRFVVSAKVVARATGRPAVLSGAETGAVHITDLVTGDNKPLIGEQLDWGRAAVGVDALATVHQQDQTIVVAGMSNGLIRTWNLDTGSAWAEPWQAHARGITAIAPTIAADHPVIVSGSYDGTVRTWDVTGEPRQAIELGTPITDLAVTPAGDPSSQPTEASSYSTGGPLWPEIAKVVCSAAREIRSSSPLSA